MFGLQKELAGLTQAGSAGGPDAPVLDNRFFNTMRPVITAAGAAAGTFKMRFP